MQRLLSGESKKGEVRGKHAMPFSGLYGWSSLAGKFIPIVFLLTRNVDAGERMEQKMR